MSCALSYKREKMPMYIDVDAVNRVFVDELGKIPSVVITERIEWDAAREAIIRCARGVSTIPTADVVEVVRCKDCKYMPTGDGANHNLEFPEDFKCPCQCDDFWYSWKPDDNWFCGNGERRDDG